MVNIYRVKVEVNIPMFIEPETDNCISIVFRVVYQELQSKQVKHEKQEIQVLPSWSPGTSKTVT